MKPLTGCTGSLLSLFKGTTQFVKQKVLFKRRAKIEKDEAFSDTTDPYKDRTFGRVLIIGYVILVIFLSLSQIICAFAQNPPQGLKPGDPVPESFWQQQVRLPDESPGNTVPATLASFRGKLIILDFWATWCSPCIAMIPRTDSLQKVFDGQVQFVPVTYQPDRVVHPFIEKLAKQKGRGFGLPEITGNKTLRLLFPHTYLPHYVWIDDSGTVKAITEASAITASNISRMLKEGALAVRPKADPEPVPYDMNKPMLLGNNGGDGKNILYHSLLTGYTEGLSPGGIIKTDTASGKRISFRNQSISRLFQIAWSEDGKVFNPMNTSLDVEHPEKLYSRAFGMEYLDWMRQGNVFCYELIVPGPLIPQAFRFMRQDLDRFFFQYSVSVKKVMKPCYVLSRTGDSDLLKSRGGPRVLTYKMGYSLRNVFLGELVYQLNYTSRAHRFIVDETGYEEKVDLETSAMLPDLEGVNSDLKKYGLRFTEAKREMEMLVITDRH